MPDRGERSRKINGENFRVGVQAGPGGRECVVQEQRWAVWSWKRGLEGLLSGRIIKRVGQTWSSLGIHGALVPGAPVDTNIQGCSGLSY